jgi:hypothetical protein
METHLHAVKDRELPTIESLTLARASIRGSLKRTSGIKR